MSVSLSVVGASGMAAMSWNWSSSPARSASARNDAAAVIRTQFVFSEAADSAVAVHGTGKDAAAGVAEAAVVAGVPALDEVFRMTYGVDEKEFCPKGLEGLKLIVFHCCRDLLLNICVWLRVFPLSKVDERPLFAPMADVVFGGLEGDAERGSDIDKRPAVELVRETVEEEMAARISLSSGTHWTGAAL